MSDIQIDYTSRDYEALRSDLVSLIRNRTGLDWNPTDPSDLGSILVEAFAYMGDIMSYYIDRSANETSLATAVKRDTLLNFANLYGYKPSGPTPALVNVSFTNNGVSSIDLPKGTQVMASLATAPFKEVFFETTTSVTALLAGQSISILCEEGKTVNTDRPDLIDAVYNIALPSSLGNSDGTANQEFDVIDTGVVDNSITVYVGQGSAFTPWAYVSSLSEHGPTELVFTTRQNEDGTLTVIFGDGVTGAIPSAGQLISTVYKTSVGVAGNVKAGTITEVTFIPGNSDLTAIATLQVTNSGAAVGGADGDDFTQLRTKIQAAITTRRRAVTLNDYESLALQVPQVGKVNAAANVYSLVNIYLQSQDDTSTKPGITDTTATITNVSGSGTTVTVTANNSFTAGDIVVISGVNPTAYNVVATIATASSTNFTYSATTTTAYVSGGVATKGTPTSSWNSLKTAVESYLADKIMVGTTVSVKPPVYVPIYIEVVAFAGSAYKNEDVRLAIYRAFLGTNGLFSYSNNTFGRSIPFSAVVYAAQAVDGIISTTISKLNTDGSSTAATINLAANQIPYLTPANLSITVTGGI